MFVIDSTDDLKCTDATDADRVPEWIEVYFTGNILNFKIQQIKRDL